MTFDKMEQPPRCARMAKWRSQVEGWLASLEKRGTFDVAEYKQTVAKHVVSKSMDDQPRASFASVVDVNDRASVCRTFLTVLMMCYEKSAAMDISSDCPKTDGTSHWDTLHAVGADGIFRDFNISLTAPFETLTQGYAALMHNENDSRQASGR